jgi:hypothetical protein
MVYSSHLNFRRCCLRRSRPPVLICTLRALASQRLAENPIVKSILIAEALP